MKASKRRTTAVKPSGSPLAGLKASVILERAGACVRVDDVPACEAFNVLAELLGAMRVAASVCPELTVELSPVAGYSPLDVNTDDIGAKRKVGFRS
jgi:hypothetical protein